MSQENNNLNTGNVLSTTDNTTQFHALGALSKDSVVNFKAETQKAIVELADKIDVTKRDKVVSYASVPLQHAIENNTKFLTKMMNTEEDYQVVENISALSQQIDSQIGEIKIVPKKKNFLEKLFGSLFGKQDRKDTIEKIKSCKDLIDRLQEAMERQIDIVSERSNDARNNNKFHIDAVEALEQYIVAGYIATDRIDDEISSLSTRNDLLIGEQFKLKELSNGNDNFKIVLNVLEETRGGSAIAIMQTAAAIDCLDKLEINFRSTMYSILLLFSQQASSSLINYTVSNAVENHRSITKLTASMMEENSAMVADNYQKVSELITDGVSDPEKMLKCAEIMVEGSRKANEIVKNYISSLDGEKTTLISALDKANQFLSDTIIDITSDSNGSSTGSKFSSSKNSLTF